MIFDSHAHIFTNTIVENVIRKPDMIKRLGLYTQNASKRTGGEALVRHMEASGVEACLILPTSNAENIIKTNRRFIEISGISERIHTAGTLHPDFSGNREELEFLGALGISAIKLCSFSQGFELTGPNTISMFELISEYNKNHKAGFIVVLDTFYTAGKFFGTPAKFSTTPALLDDLTRGFPCINFIAAHMGGLDAPFKEISENLHTRGNLYLDTSNAAHTLDNAEFVRLLKAHGPEHILFGTDWPWFEYGMEIILIESLLGEAGYSEEQKKAVFGKNIKRLLGLNKDM